MDRESSSAGVVGLLIAGAVLFAAGLIIGNFDSNWEDPIGGVDAFYEISQIVGMGLGQILFVDRTAGTAEGFTPNAAEA